MPYYEYTCQPCALTTMLSRTVEERDNPVTCTKCHQPMNRTYTTPAISFKGSGFYTTDKKAK